MSVNEKGWQLLGNHRDSLPLAHLGTGIASVHSRVATCAPRNKYRNVWLQERATKRSKLLLSGLKIIYETKQTRRCPALSSTFWIDCRSGPKNHLAYAPKNTIQTLQRSFLI